MLIHNVCGGTAGIRLKNTTLIAIDIGIEINHSIINTCDIGTVDYEEKPPYEFICRRCGQLVLKENLLVSCGSCNRHISLDKIYRVKGRGGRYCKRCLNNLKEACPEEEIIAVPFSEILEGPLKFN